MRELPSLKYPNVPTLYAKKTRLIEYRHRGCFMSSLQRGSKTNSLKRFRIPIKELYHKPKKLFLSSRKYDPGFSSRIRIPDLDLGYLLIPDPGSRGQKGTGSRIRIRNTGFKWPNRLGILNMLKDISWSLTTFLA